MLNLVSLEKKYKDHIVFSNMSIEFTNGNLYILMGVNGSGKSTILKLIAGLIYKTDGKIIKDGVISYLPDKFSMPKLMKVKNYLYEIFYDRKDKNNASKEFDCSIYIIDIVVTKIPLNIDNTNNDCIKYFS